MPGLNDSNGDVSDGAGGSTGVLGDEVDLSLRVLHLVMSLPIIVFSALVLYAVYVFRQLRHKHTPFLISLCLADVMTGIASIFCNGPRLLRDVDESSLRLSCIWCTYLSYAAPTTAWATVLLVTLERFLLLTPVHALLKDYQRAVVTLTVVWLLTWSGGCFLFEWNEYTPSRPCHLEWVMPVFSQRVLLALTSGGLGVHAAMYGHILRRSCQYSASVHPETTVSSSARTRRRDKRVHRMILIIVAARTACWLPLVVLLASARSGYTWIQPLRAVAYTMVLCSSMLNPVVYCMYSSPVTQSIDACCSYYCPGRCCTYTQQTADHLAAEDVRIQPRSAEEHI